MHSTIAKLSPLERAYLNAVFHYYVEAGKNGQKSSPEEAEINDRVFDLIRSGHSELAAVEAGKNDVTLEIWTKAVDAANI